MSIRDRQVQKSIGLYCNTVLRKLHDKAGSTALMLEKVAKAEHERRCRLWEGWPKSVARASPLFPEYYYSAFIYIHITRHINLKELVGSRRRLAVSRYLRSNLINAGLKFTMPTRLLPPTQAGE